MIEGVGTGVIITSRRPLRHHKAPNPHVLSRRTRLIGLCAEPIAGNHTLGRATMTPVSQADFRSYPLCNCDHTAGSVPHFVVAAVEGGGGNWTRSAQLVPFSGGCVVGIALRTFRRRIRSNCCSLGEESFHRRDMGEHHAVDLPVYALLNSTR